MRRLLLMVVVLVGSVAAALWFDRQNGFVLIRLGELTVQASLFIAVLGLAVAWAAVTLVLWIIRGISRTPSGLKERWDNRQLVRSREHLVDALIELAEGRYSDARRHLSGTAEKSELPLFSHLLSAVAAQREDDWQARDEALALADQAEPRARVAVGLLQAQLQAEVRQWEEAIATLGWLREQAPRNHRVLTLYAQALEAVGDDKGLANLLPELRREKALPEERIVRIEAHAFEQALLDLGPDATARDLEAVWKRLPRNRQADSLLRARYLRALMAAGCPAHALQLLKRWLKARWDAVLVDVFGEIVSDPPHQAYEQAQQWLNERPEDADLLFAAARQAMHCELWGQARSYLEAAAARSDRSDINQALAELYEQLGESDQARLAYRSALDHQRG